MKKERFIPWGRTLTTKDNYLPSSTKSTKTRPVVVVDNNKNDLAVVPLSTTPGKNRTELKGYKNPKTNRPTYYKHYLETKDNEGQPIRVNDKFRENHKNMDVSRDQVLDIRQKILTDVRTKQRNRKMLDAFHSKRK